MTNEDTDEVIERAERMLQASYAGFEQFVDAEGDEKFLGLYNTVTCGRNVTFIIQNLRGKEEGFDEWYDKRIEVLKEDEVCSYMKELRNSIVKEGDSNTGLHLDIDGTLHLADVLKDVPPWADKAFIGDELGRSGYEIEHGDGTSTTYYIDIPDEVMEFEFHFPELTESRGNRLVPADDDLRYYLKVLEEFVTDAKTEFHSDYK